MAGLLAPADRHQADARELGDLLRQVGIGEVLDLGEGQGIGGEGERQDRRVRRVDLAVDRRARQVAGQEGPRHVDRGLDLLLGHVDLVLERELQRDERRPEGAGGGHLPESRQLAELTLERRRHRRDHHVGARARVEGQDLDRRVVDLRQGRDGKQQVRDHAGEEHRGRQERGGDGPEDEDPGGVQSVTRMPSGGPVRACFTDEQYPGVVDQTIGVRAIPLPCRPLTR
jgi:hypothetical protein